MRLPEDIIIKPYVTERSTEALEHGKYTFVVAKDATKTEIRIAVEQLFQVKVLSVNTMNFDGKVKRQGVHVGKRSDWKKAIIKIDTEPEAVKYLAKGGKSASSNKKYKNSIEEFGFAQ